MYRILTAILLVAATAAEAQTPNDIDKAISDNRLAEATQMVNALKPRYPDNAVLLYLESRLQVRKEDFGGARVSLSAAKSKSDLGFVETNALTLHEQTIIKGLQAAQTLTSAPAPAPTPTPTIVVNLPIQPVITPLPNQILPSISIQPTNLPGSEPVSTSARSTTTMGGLGNSPLAMPKATSSKWMGLDPFDWMIIGAFVGFSLLMYFMNRKKKSKLLNGATLTSGLTASTVEGKPSFFDRFHKNKKNSTVHTDPIPAKPDDFNLAGPKA